MLENEIKHFFQHIDDTKMIDDILLDLADYQEDFLNESDIEKVERLDYYFGRTNFIE